MDEVYDLFLSSPNPELVDSVADISYIANVCEFVDLREITDVCKVMYVCEVADIIIRRCLLLPDCMLQLLTP